MICSGRLGRRFADDCADGDLDTICFWLERGLDINRLCGCTNQEYTSDFTVRAALRGRLDGPVEGPVAGTPGKGAMKLVVDAS